MIHLFVHFAIIYPLWCLCYINCLVHILKHFTAILTLGCRMSMYDRTLTYVEICFLVSLPIKRHVLVHFLYNVELTCSHCSQNSSLSPVQMDWTNWVSALKVKWGTLDRPGVKIKTVLKRYSSQTLSVVFLCGFSLDNSKQCTSLRTDPKSNAKVTRLWCKTWI